MTSSRHDPFAFVRRLVHSVATRSGANFFCHSPDDLSLPLAGADDQHSRKEQTAGPSECDALMQCRRHAVPRRSPSARDSYQCRVPEVAIRTSSAKSRVMMAAIPALSARLSLSDSKLKSPRSDRLHSVNPGCRAKPLRARGRSDSCRRDAFF